VPAIHGKPDRGPKWDVSHLRQAGSSEAYPRAVRISPASAFAIATSSDRHSDTQSQGGLCGTRHDPPGIRIALPLLAYGLHPMRAREPPLNSI
jgi:hypothetical protein